MFTGIVEELGSIIAIEQLEGNAARIRIGGPLVTSDATHGASISVNGVCLTVIDLDQNAGEFSADVMGETLKLTSIGSTPIGQGVNLERAMQADGRLGGHIVAGHVDGLGLIISRSPAPHWDVVRIGVDERLAYQIATKGSVTVDGVSLTVTAVGGSHWFEVSLIPETLAATTLGSRRVGDHVNIETDVLAKYLERLMEGRAP